jgi:mRNA interferase MazF
MNRGEIWFTEVGGKRRPVLILTRDAVIDVRELVTVVEVTTMIRGTSAEVQFDWDGVGLARECVINCDGVHTIRQRDLTTLLGRVSDTAMERVCSALTYAIGC